ncbi:carbohydrate binding domain-containing protein [Caldanaerobius polysaccharolyticus]|uniref:carbohydrate binding domain-containing protein n=1 Tax=Caldanaerobius polysaccharolyticus TaxID=44256 RepID=UPI00047CA066|nr:carbohydrate binding domain-containing protein [Caldanaerobius polysaccharolyticus]
MKKRKMLSLLVSFMLLITAFMPVNKVVAAKLPDASGNLSVNLVVNGDFESGNIDGWTKHGNPTLEITSEQAIGNYSLKVTGRTQTYEGPAYDLLGKMENGKTYNITLKVRAVSGQIAMGHPNPPKITVTMRRKYIPNTEGGEKEKWKVKYR